MIVLFDYLIWNIVNWNMGPWKQCLLGTTPKIGNSMYLLWKKSVCFPLFFFQKSPIASWFFCYFWLIFNVFWNKMALQTLILATWKITGDLLRDYQLETHSICNIPRCIVLQMINFIFCISFCSAHFDNNHSITETYNA